MAQKTTSKPKAAKRTAHAAPQGRQERPPATAATKKTTRAKRAPQAARNADASQPTSPVRETKRGTVLTLLEREGGATLDELVAATNWQRHYADVRIMPTCAGNPACGAGIAAMESA